MTTLAIVATYEKKQLKCYGTVAAGEHVAVTVTDGAQWIGEGKALRLRVLFGPNTVAVFPFAEGDAWTAAGTQDADSACELNLNTLQAEKYLKCGGTCLWILDDVENHTLYATGEFGVLPWPKRRGIDEPIDLDGYPQLVEDIEELKEAWDEYQRTIARELAAKQDAINDLSEIREGASAGASALQPAEILDGGKVKSDLLPSYVDDVLEFASRSAFPATGESGKIYVALDTNRTYRWSGTQYTEIANPDLDNTVTPTSGNGVKSSGIWSAIWGALSALPTGFTSLYDWCVAQLAGKQSSLAPGAVTVPGIIKTVYAGVKRQGSTVLLQLPTSGVTVNGKALTGDVSLTGADIAVSGTDATTIDAALAGKLDKSGGTITGTLFCKSVVQLSDGGPLVIGGSEQARDGATLGTAGTTRWVGNTTYTQTIPLKSGTYALTADLPYSLATPIVIDTASSETVEGETVNYGAATLADRTANIVQVTAATPLDELRITFPAATSGKVRDFGLRVEIGTGSAALAAPALVPIAPTGETIKIENNAAEIPALADGTATAKGVTLLYFSENAPGIFVVKGEQVEEVA